MPWYPTNPGLFNFLRESFHKYLGFPSVPSRWNTSRTSWADIPKPFRCEAAIIWFFSHFPLIILSIHGSLTNTIRNILIFVFAPFMKVIVNDKLGKDSIVFVCLFSSEENYAVFWELFALISGRSTAGERNNDDSFHTVRHRARDSGRKKLVRKSRKLFSGSSEIPFNLFHGAQSLPLSLPRSLTTLFHEWNSNSSEWMAVVTVFCLATPSVAVSLAFRALELKAYRFSSVTERLSWMKWGFWSVVRW